MLFAPPQEELQQVMSEAGGLKSGLFGPPVGEGVPPSKRYTFNVVGATVSKDAGMKVVPAARPKFKLFGK